MKKDNKTFYSPITKILHWVRLFLLVSIYRFAWIGDGSYFYMHKILGSILFLVILVSILWRIFNVYPQSSASSVVEKNIQFLIYIFIYTFLLITPIFGYLGSLYGVYMYFFNIPSIYSINCVSNFIINYVGVEPKAFSMVIKFAHKIIAQWILLALIFLHVLAIMFNLVVKKHNDIKKMI